MKFVLFSYFRRKARFFVKFIAIMTSDGEHILELLANDLMELDQLTHIENKHSENIKKLDFETCFDAADHETGTWFRVDSEDDCDLFIKENENKNTMYKTTSDVNLFNDWTSLIGEEWDIVDIQASELDSLLARFFLCMYQKLFLYQSFYYLWIFIISR